jgi:hypothetical protein
MKHKNIYIFNFFIKNRLLKNNFVLCCHFVKSEKKVNNALNLFVQTNNLVKIKLKNNFLKNIINKTFISCCSENSKLNINKGFKVYFFSNNLLIFVNLCKYIQENNLPIIPFTILTKDRQININYLLMLYKKNIQYVSNDKNDSYKLSQKLIQKIFIANTNIFLNNFNTFSLFSHKIILFQLFKLIEYFKYKN